MYITCCLEKLPVGDREGKIHDVPSGGHGKGQSDDLSHILFLGGGLISVYLWLNSFSIIIHTLLRVSLNLFVVTKMLAQNAF